MLRVCVHDGDVETNITEEVRMVMDALYSSLDWGSNFLSTEEVEAWHTIANAMKFTPEIYRRMKTSE